MMFRRILVILIASLLVIQLLISPPISTLQSHGTNNEVGQDSYGLILHEIIRGALGAVNNWNSTSMLDRGLIFGTLNFSSIDKISQNNLETNNSLSMVDLKRFSEMQGYSSATLDAALLKVIRHMNDSGLELPSTNDFFSIWNFRYLHLYRYLEEAGITNFSSNITHAADRLIDCYLSSSNRSYYRCNYQTGSADSLFGTRFMNVANFAQMMMIFYEQTQNNTYLELALDQWDKLQTVYWSDSKQGFNYSPNWKIWEWSTIEMVFAFDLLRTINGSLHSWDRIYTDLGSRYLNDGWGAPLWKNGLILHYQGSGQRRVHGTVDAWLLLQSYYQYLSYTQKTIMKQMLEGYDNVKPAWRQILEVDGRVYSYHDYRFRLDSDGTWSDFGTAEALFLLLLTGISPQTGKGLMISKISEGYSGGKLPSNQFRLYYDSRELVIPVYGGSELRFLYGNIPVDYIFENNGLHRIIFSEDWNSIIRVDPLDETQFYDMTMQKDVSIYEPIDPMETVATSKEESSISSTTKDESSSISSDVNNLSSSSSTDKAPYAFLPITMMLVIIPVLRRYKSVK